VTACDMTETEFRKHLILHIGARRRYRVWPQNCGKILIAQKGGTKRAFDAGPPKGAHDISGIVTPEGWRIEFEIKGEVTPVTTEQERWATLMQEMGAVVAFYRIDRSRSLEENLDRAAYALDEAIEVRRRGGLVSRNCDCASCGIVRQVPA
jgi:hypothetical protein